MTKEIDYDKNLVVTQDNRITQTARAEKEAMSLTVYQKRLLLYLTSRIKPTDTELKTQEITFSDYMSLTGLQRGGTQEQQIKKSILDLCRKKFLVDVTPTLTQVFSWIDDSKTEIDWEKKIIRTALGARLKDYFIGLSGKFTAYQLGYTTGFRSKYTYRLYEYLHSYIGQGGITIQKDDAYKILCDNKYDKVYDFERYVVERAIEEINQFSDIEASYQRITQRGKVVSFTFRVHSKTEKEKEIIRSRWIKKTSGKQVSAEIGEVLPF